MKKWKYVLTVRSFNKFHEEHTYRSERTAKREMNRWRKKGFYADYEIVPEA